MRMRPDIDLTAKQQALYKPTCFNLRVLAIYRPLSRDVTHDELRIWPPCWRENKKEQKKVSEKIRE